jgi:ribosome-binding ATPase YchF (GTP1/OBG family)
MKICILGCDLPEGKVKYQDERIITLEQKLSPKKVTPFYVDFLTEDFCHCDAFVVSPEKLLDLIILDMEKCEARRDRTDSEEEKQLMLRCLDCLEQETPLCDAEFSEADLALLKALAPVTLKPTLVVEPDSATNQVIEKMLDKAGVVFFYTADKKEVHSWPVPKDSDIVTCAGKIHSDLARGFIKADIISYEDFLGVYNMQEGRTKGLVKVVDRDYLIRPGDIIEIRFNV